MASDMQKLFQNYDDIVGTTRDPLVDSWFLMGSPVPVLLIACSYLYFVLKLGPRLMVSRKPYDLQVLLVVYNFIMVLVSLYLALLPVVKGLMTHLVAEGCSPKLRGPSELSYTFSSYAWWYFMTKIAELTDTVFFVLRKKQKQVSFLHVYHHSSVAVFTWGYLKYLPGEQGVMIAFLNSVVHVFMYFYYMVAALGPRYQKYVWWKKYITWIQLVQFLLMLGYLASLALSDCEMPRAVSYFIGLHVFVFLCLFTNFYRQTYKRSQHVN